MPIAIIIGAIFCREVAWVDAATDGWMTPSFIFIMLFFTFCKVDARKIRLTWLHLSHNDVPPSKGVIDSK